MDQKVWNRNNRGSGSRRGDGEGARGPGAHRMQWMQQASSVYPQKSTALLGEIVYIIVEL